MNKDLRIKNKGAKTPNSKFITPNSRASKLNQKGLASIVVVTVLVVLLTLISIGFARLMSRSVSNSTNSQLAAAANYAAQSGVNDAIAYLQQNLNPGTGNVTADIEAKQCNDLLDTTSGHTDTTKINPHFSGNANAAYTCILLNSQPPNLFYQSLPASSSQIIKMTTTPSNVGSVMLSWQGAANPPQNNFPSSGSSLLTETAWASAKNAPLLRVTLYPIANDSAPLDAGVQQNSRTFFLYPSSSAGAVNSMGYSTADGSLVATKCDTTTGKAFTGFVNSDFNCNLIITGLQGATTPGPEYFYVRLTPVYGQASVNIVADDPSSNAVKFVNVQAVTDVTAKVNTAAKRLRARVELNGSANVPAGSINIPQGGLRSADAVCKRLQVLPGGGINIDGTFCQGQLTISVPAIPGCTDPAAGNYNASANVDDGSCTCANGATNYPACTAAAPTVSVLINSASSANITAGDSATLAWSSSSATTCTPSGSGSWPTSPLPNSSSSASVSPGEGAYTYHLACTGAGGTAQAEATLYVIAQPSGPKPVDVYVCLALSGCGSGSDWSADIADHGDHAGLDHCDSYDTDGNYVTSIGFSGTNHEEGGIYVIGGGGNDINHLICYATDGASGDAWMDGGSTGPPGPSGYAFYIAFFNAVGWKINPPDHPTRYCPDGVHQWVACTSWATIGQGVYCYEVYSRTDIFGNIHYGDTSPQLAASGGGGSGSGNGFTYGTNDFNVAQGGNIRIDCYDAFGGHDYLSANVYQPTP